MSTAWSAARPGAVRRRADAPPGQLSSAGPGASTAASSERFSSSTRSSGASGSAGFPAAGAEGLHGQLHYPHGVAHLLQVADPSPRFRGASATIWPSQATLTAMSPMRSRCRLMWRIAVSRRRSEATRRGGGRATRPPAARCPGSARSTSSSPATTALHRAASPVTSPRVARARRLRTSAWACTSASRRSRVSWKRVSVRWAASASLPRGAGAGARPHPDRSRRRPPFEGRATLRQGAVQPFAVWLGPARSERRQEHCRAGGAR